MPQVDGCAKTREELVVEVQQLRRELSLLQAAHSVETPAGNVASEWPPFLLDHLDEFVILLDAGGHVLSANQAFLQGCGLDANDAVGQPFWLFDCWKVSREVTTQFRKALRRSLSGTVTRYETELLGAESGRAVVAVDLTLKPLKDEAGRVTSVLIEGRDITARKKARKEVEKKTEEQRILYEQLKEFDHLRTRFFANVSHDLRTPLTLILGPIRRLLDRTETTKQQRQGLRLIERNAGLLAHRVNKLLDLSKLEADEMQARYTQTDLCKLGRLVASHFEGFAEEKDLTFSVEMPETLVAEIDSEKIQRVLLNLLSNAFKFTPRGGAVSLTLVADQKRAMYCVQDTGAGIVPNQREVIFERFRQDYTRLERPLLGTGLGLSIVKEFVQLHGGKVYVEEAPLGGASFVVELPLHAPGGTEILTGLPAENTFDWGKQTVSELKSYAKPRPSARTKPRPNTPLILVVEDNPDMNDFLVETIGEDYRVVTAFDGHQGFQKAVDLRPDLILTDMMMPHMSGEDLVRRIRKTPMLADIPVVLLTAKADDQLHVKLLNEGAMWYLNKPFSASELLAGVRRLITERRRSQASLRKTYSLLHSVTEGITDAVFVKDQKGRYLMINSAGARSVGQSPQAVLGKDDRALFPEETAERIMQEDRQVMETGQAKTYEQEATVLGVTRNYLATRVPYRDDEGNILGVMGISRDITEQKKSEQELREAKETAEAANRSKDRFLAILSHELRTPLTPVLATVSYMENCQNLPAEFQSEITMIRRNVEMEARLIDDLLDLTRISRNKIELHPEAVDAHASLRRALEICQGDIDNKQIRVSQTLWADNHHIWADPARIQQVFWNLINNAVKFTPKGGEIILKTANIVGIAKNGKRTAQLIVEVADTGVGIAPEVLPRIFSAFEQGERTVTREFGGLGLGLAISRALIRMHQGTLTAHSDGVNQGATFRLGFGTVDSSLVMDRPTPLPVNRKQESVQRKILLVEDHEDTLQMMQQLLTMFGYAVATANCVESAREICEGHSFDLVISDIGLPDGTGLDVMKNFREFNETAKGIALSGFGMEEDLQRSREAGFARHLTKPVNLETLEQTINDVLG